MNETKTSGSEETGETFVLHASDPRVGPLLAMYAELLAYSSDACDFGRCEEVMIVARRFAAKARVDNEARVEDAVERLGLHKRAMGYVFGLAYEPIDGVPTSYRCSQCKKHGCKLWRQYQTFASHIELMCVECSIADQRRVASSVPATAGDVGDDGRWLTDHGKTSAIGWLVPAVPSGDTFWGYTSVPPEAAAWWRALPTRLP